MERCEPGIAAWTSTEHTLYKEDYEGRNVSLGQDRIDAEHKDLQLAYFQAADPNFNRLWQERSVIRFLLGPLTKK